jgi:outer membrane murein-binding lipoprotein Lpp
MAAGFYIGRDEDFIIMIPHGSEGKTELVEIYKDWLVKVRPLAGVTHRAAGGGPDVPQVMDTRFPREWLQEIEAGYAAWKKGEELPVEGFPLKQWPVISKAMLDNCLSVHIRTVEQLAGATDEHIAPLGMGARTLRNQAEQWLKLNSDKDKAKMVTQLSQLSSDVAQLTAQVKSLLEENQRLAQQVPAKV